MFRLLLAILLIDSLVSAAQSVETLNDVALSAMPVKNYIVNHEGRMLPGTIVYGRSSFSMKASSSYYKAPSPHRNFIRTQVTKASTVNNDFNLDLPLPPKSQTYEYFDGLGTLVQTINVTASPSKSDVINFTIRDEYDREVKNYLPYTKKGGGAFRDSLLDEQLAFYKSTPNVVSEKEPFGVNEYDNSPMKNLKRSFPVGWTWHTATPNINELRINGATDVRKLVLNAAGIPAYTANQYFPKGHFVVTETSDEAGLIRRKFKNLFNQVVLERVGKGTTWHDTYYVYDNQGNVRYIFPPEASARLSSYASTSNKQSFLDLWCFQFKYDPRGRVIEKKIPGAGWVYIVYDLWDRVVLTQDANQRVKNEWTFMKYDVHNRVIMTGITSGVRTTLEQQAKSNTVRFEERAKNAIGYTNKCFPIHTEAGLLTVNYFDCYQFITYPSWDVEKNDYRPRPVAGILDTAEIFYQASATSIFLPVVRGQQTGAKVKVLGTDKWLNNVVFYDKQYRVVQSIQENYLSGMEIITSKYDPISGLKLKSHHQHKSQYTSRTIEEEFVYDHNDRLLKVYHNIGEKQKVLLLSNSYNELGQLIEKNIHSTDETNFLQSVDYRYNIQGWLTHINNSSLTNDGISNNDSNDFFGMEIIYTDKVDANNGAFKTDAHYDGNVAAVKWKTRTDDGSVPQERMYAFQYDPIKRMSKSYYVTNSAGKWTGNAGLYNENISFYDANGNIGATGATGLTRQGLSGNTSTLIDNLAYFYNGNQLLHVKDNSTNTLGFQDKPGVDPSVREFEYDKAGNMVFDLNKSISSIKYNHLNLPEEIQFVRSSPVRTDRIVYTYDALGNVLRKQVFVGASSVWITDYASGVQYDNRLLSYVTTPEGRAVLDGTDFSYEYFIKDHQGNIRVVCGLLKETNSFLATMETQLESQEVNKYGFTNIAASRSVGNNFTTPSEIVLSPDKSARCNSFSNSSISAVPVGPAKLLTVSSGDAIYAEVYSRFNNVRSNSSVIVPALLGASVNKAFGITRAEKPALFDNVNARAPIVATDSSYADIVPRGYIALLFFDANYNFVSATVNCISARSYQAFEKLPISFKCDRNGIVLIYVANESAAGQAVDVYFDDLYIIHEKNTLTPQVVQASDYYPLGLQFNEYNKDRIKIVSTSPKPIYEPMVRNRYLFQGQELQRDLGLGWYQFRFRMHDPAIGRFGSVDPLAEKYSYLSPYSFSGNQLTNAVELEGAEPKTVYETLKSFSPIAFKFDYSYTSHDSRIGFNISVGLPKFLPFSYRREFGRSYNFSDIIQGTGVSESRSAVETSMFSGLVSFKTTTYNSIGFDRNGQLQSTSQTTGMVTLGRSMLNISYENDYFPASTMKFLDPFNFHPVEGGDGRDRFRTAAMSLNAGLFTTGFNLATGDPGPLRKEAVLDVGGKNGTYCLNIYNGVLMDPDRYRLGLGYVGFGGLRLGMNSEAMRHQIQNVWVHDNLPNSPWFRVMPGPNQLYFGFSNGSTTQW